MSYIPRSSAVPQGATGAIPRLVKKRHTFRVFGFIAAVLLMASIIGVAGTYIYGSIIEKRLVETQLELTRTASNADVTEDIEDLETFEKKMETARMLLDNHQAPSLIFKDLEFSTKGTVQFTGFTYTYDPGFQALLELRGVTKTLSSVALQNEEFLESSLFEGFDIKEISLANSTEDEAETIVNFTVTGEVDQDDFAYNGTPIQAVTEVMSPIINSAVSTTSQEEGTSTEIIIE